MLFIEYSRIFQFCYVSIYFHYLIEFSYKFFFLFWYIFSYQMFRFHVKILAQLIPNECCGFLSIWLRNTGYIGTISKNASWNVTFQKHYWISVIRYMNTHTIFNFIWPHFHNCPPCICAAGNIDSYYRSLLPNGGKYWHATADEVTW